MLTTFPVRSLCLRIKVSSRLLLQKHACLPACHAFHGEAHGLTLWNWKLPISSLFSKLPWSWCFVTTVEKEDTLSECLSDPVLAPPSCLLSVHVTLSICIDSNCTSLKIDHSRQQNCFLGQRCSSPSLRTCESTRCLICTTAVPFCTYCFPVTVTKCLKRSNSREETLLWLMVSGKQPIMTGKAWQ